MKSEFAKALRCTRCDRAGLRVEAASSDSREVREGVLDCTGCGARFAIAHGIPDFLDPEDRQLAGEVAGWERLAGDLSDALIPTMTALPWYPHPPWPHLAPDFFQLFEHVGFRDARVVEIGAGRCWASRFLKTLGPAAEVAAVDVLTVPFLGLRTADVYFEQDGIHFERLRADAHRMPFQDGWADTVVACASVHHSSDLARLFREVARVLRRGGLFAFLSEPTRRLADANQVPDNDETRVGINENIYRLADYEEALRGAGFRWRRLIPRSIRFRRAQGDPVLREMMPVRLHDLGATRPGRRAVQLLLRSPLLGRFLLRRSSLPLSVLAWKR